jgi:hypothetical protein
MTIISLFPQTMINNIKSFMFDKALNLSEDELNAILFDFGKQSVTVDVVCDEKETINPSDSLDIFLTSDDLGLKLDSEDVSQEDEQLFVDSNSCDKVVLMDGDVDDEGGNTPVIAQNSNLEREIFSEATFIV